MEAREADLINYTESVNEHIVEYNNQLISKVLQLLLMNPWLKELIWSYDCWENRESSDEAYIYRGGVWLQKRLYTYKYIVLNFQEMNVYDFSDFATNIGKLNGAAMDVMKWKMKIFFIGTVNSVRQS